VTFICGLTTAVIIGLMKQSYLSTVALAGACTIALASAAVAYPGEKEYGKLVKVNLAQAQATALNATHGKIVASELEKEPGGSGLRYSFDVQVGSSTHEVGVDAITGKLLEDIKEGKDAD
jgi:uncharacterized membrane protein YkoI